MKFAELGLPADVQIRRAAAGVLVVEDSAGAPAALTVGEFTSTPEAWVAATYQNGWATQAASQAAGYRKHNGKGYLRGLMTGAAATAITAFTLPVGYRPAVDTRYSLSYWDVTALLYRPGAIIVRTTGAVQIEDNTASAAVAANVQFVSLDPVEFWL